MEVTCRQPNCTVAQTGICLLNNDVATCPQRVTDGSIEVADQLTTVLESPAENPKFPGSYTLAIDGVRKLTSSRYCRLIGILGAPDAGKTALLVSLYLLVGHAKLDGFEYCDSQSLIAFEEISRGTRRWNDGQPPEQMTGHTRLEEGRSAGFLHLKLRSKPDGEVFDLLLPDLPGEWSTSLVDKQRTDRLSFLKRADVIWLMVDGRSLQNSKTRMHALHRIGMMMQRIAELLNPDVPPVTLIVTRLDLGAPTEAVVTCLRALAVEHNIVNLNICSVASFSNAKDVKAGAGISELLRHAVGLASKSEPHTWPGRAVISGDRAMMRLRDFRDAS